MVHEEETSMAWEQKFCRGRGHWGGQWKRSRKGEVGVKKISYANPHVRKNIKKDCHTLPYKKSFLKKPQDNPSLKGKTRPEKVKKEAKERHTRKKLLYEVGIKSYHVTNKKGAGRGGT